jgi:hypothetical protein
MSGIGLQTTFLKIDCIFVLEMSIRLHLFDRNNPSMFFLVALMHAFIHLEKSALLVELWDL